MPSWFSRMTVPNQPINSTASMAKPRDRISEPAPAPSMVPTAPSMTVNRVTEPKNGQGLPWGM